MTISIKPELAYAQAPINRQNFRGKSFLSRLLFPPHRGNVLMT